MELEGEYYASRGHDYMENSYTHMHTQWGRWGGTGRAVIMTIKM